MREYRGKWIDTGEWVNGWFLRQPNFDSKNCGYLIADLATQAWLPVDPKTIGQLIGRCDENGKEIYEGDIVKKCVEIKIYDNNWKKWNSYKKTDVIFTVEYTNDAKIAHWMGNVAMYRLANPVILEFPNDSSYRYDNLNDYYFRANEIEVIGNIHDNPELIDAT